jgi:hypothetical protein
VTDGVINVRERVAALEALDGLAWQLNAAAGWLADGGCETEADMTEQAARGILAACWLLSRPIRSSPGPERWQVAANAAAVNGYGHRA